MMTDRELENMSGGTLDNDAKGDCEIDDGVVVREVEGMLVRTIEVPVYCDGGITELLFGRAEDEVNDTDDDEEAKYTRLVDEEALAADDTSLVVDERALIDN